VTGPSISFGPRPSDVGGCNFCPARAFAEVFELASYHPSCNLRVRICPDCVEELRKQLPRAKRKGAEIPTEHEDLLRTLRRTIKRKYPDFRESFGFRRLGDRLRDTTGQEFFDHHDYDTKRELEELRFFKSIDGVIKTAIDLAPRGMAKKVFDFLKSND
jgi:hypothetical protein